MTTVTLEKLVIQIDPDTRRRLERLAVTRQQSAQKLLQDAIQDYVGRAEMREAFHQDGIQAWNDYQTTGLHVTGDEVIAWLATWGELDELPAPACHK